MKLFKYALFGFAVATLIQPLLSHQAFAGPPQAVGGPHSYTIQLGDTYQDNALGTDLNPAAWQDLWSSQFEFDPDDGFTSYCSSNCTYTAIHGSGDIIVQASDDAIFGLPNGYFNPQDFDGASPFSTVGDEVIYVFATTAQGTSPTPVIFNIKIDGPPTIITTTFSGIDEEQTAVGQVFADANGETFSIPGGVGADDAVFSISPAGVLSFSSAPDYDTPGDADGNNVYEVNVRVTDEDAATDDQLITVSLSPVNDNTPVADAESLTVIENGTVTQANLDVGTTLLDGDTDLDLPLDSLSASLVSGPGYASAFSLNPDGTFSYTHDGSEVTPDSFVYRVTDAAGQSDTAVVTINVSPVNDDPTVTGLPSDIPFVEDTPGNLDLSGAAFADADAGGASVTARLVTSSGTMSAASTPGVTVTGSGSSNMTLTGSIADINAFLAVPISIIYTPIFNAAGDDFATLGVAMSDGGNTGAGGGGFIALGTVNIDIAAVSDGGPTADDESFSVNEGATASQANLDVGSTLLDGDSDPDEPYETLTVSLDSGPANAASFSLNADGTFSYEHNGSETVSDSFTYTVTDSFALTDTGTVTITVVPQNDDPQVAGLPVSIAVTEDVASDIDLSASTFSDPDAGGAGVRVRLSVAAGTLVASSSGGVTIGGSGSASITLDGSFNSINNFLNNSSRVQYTTAPNDDTSTTLSVIVNDLGNTGAGGGTPLLVGTVTLDITPVNDTPSATNLTDTVVYSEDAGSVALTDIVVSDVDDADVAQTITATLTLNDRNAGVLTTSGSASYTAGTGVWTITDTLANVNAALAAVAFEPAADYDTDTAITTSVRDQDGAAAAGSPGTITLDVTPVNDAPTATNLTDTVVYAEDAGSVALTDIVVSDVDDADVAQTITATLTLNDTNAGVLTTSGSATFNGGTGVWTISDTLANVNTALAAVAFEPAADYDTDTTITTSVQDQDAATAAGSPGTITLDVTPGNDAPTATNLTDSVAYTEDAGSVALTDIVVSDVDDADVAQTITATLTLNDINAGVLTTSGSASYTAGTGVWTITDTLAAVNAALAAVAFEPAADYDTDTTITTSVRDQDSATAAGSPGTITLDVTPVNDAPTATNLTDTVVYAEDAGSVALTDIVVSDVDDADVAQTITATLTLNDINAGVLTTSGSASYTAGTGVWTITGTLSAVNAALASVAFEPAADYDTDTTITTSVQDQDSAAAAGSPGTITLDVTPANDAPTATNLTDTVVYAEDAGSVALTDIVVSDVDDADVAQTITATLTLNDINAGVLTTSGSASYTAGTGVWTITDTLAAVNAALAAVAFEPAADYDTDTTITTSVEDQDSATAAGSPGTITLDVNPKNDAPTATNLNDAVGYLEDAASVDLPDIVVSDVDDADVAQTITATLTLNDTDAGVLTTSGSATYNAGSGVWTITDTLAAVNTALGSVAFEPATDYDTDTSITTSVQDQNSATAAGSPGAIALNVTPVNDAPTATNLTDTVTYTEDVASVDLPNIVVSDVDQADVPQTITATLTLADTSGGVLTTSGSATYNPVSGVWTITDTLANVNAALATVAFEPAADYDTLTTIATEIEDQDGAAAPGSPGTITLDVTPLNDALVATNMTDTVTYNEDAATVALADIEISDVDDPDVAQTILMTLTLNDPAAGVLTTSGSATYNPGTGVWTMTDTLANVNSALASVAFEPAADYDTDTSITTAVEDQDGATAATSPGTITLDVTPVNDAPAATNLTDTVAYVEDAGSVGLTDIVVSDVDDNDVPQTITATLTLNDPAAGVLTTSGSATFNGGTGVWTISDSVASVNAALAAVAFEPAVNYDTDTTITTVVEDQDSAAAAGSPGTITLDVTPVNDAPTASNLTDTVAYTEDDATVALTDIVVADVDNGDVAQTITATLTLADSAAGALTTSGSATYNAGTGVWTITDTLASVNTALAAVAFEPAADYDTDTTITTEVRDQAPTTAAGSPGTITLDVTPVNDPPTASNLDQTVNYTEDDASVALQDIVVDDVDNGDVPQTITATLTLADADAGTLTTSGSATFDPVSGVWTVVGTLTDVNSALAAVAFQPVANYDLDTTISTSIEDQDGTAAAGSPGTINLIVTPVNDVPTFTVGPDQAVDEDSGAQTVATFITDGSPGPSFESGQTLTYNVANDNNALFSVQPAISAAGVLTYTTATDANGSATVTVSLSDDGGTANGGVDTSADQTFTITLNPIDDTPTVASPIADETVAEDAADTTIDLSSAFDDADIVWNSDTLTLSVAANTNTSLFSSVSLSGSSGAVTNSTLTLDYAADQNGTADITIEATDTAGLTVTDTFTVTVTPVNDAPTFTVGTDQTVNEDAGATTVPSFIADGSPGPANESGQTLSYNVSNDNNALFSVQPAISPTGELTFTPTADIHGSATVTVSLSDDAGTPGVDTSADQTFTINVTAVVDTPTLAVNNAITVDEDVAASLGIASSLADTDGSEALTVTIAGLPGDAEISDGVNTSDAGTTDVSSWVLGAITVVGGPHDDSDFSLTVTATATEGSNGDNTSVVETIDVTVTAVADTPNLTVTSSVSTDEDTTTPVLGIASSLVDNDGSETLLVELTGLPAGATIQDGGNTETSTGTGDVFDITSWTLGAVTTTPPLDVISNYTLTVTSTATEGANGDVADVSQTIDVVVNAINDTPTLDNPIADVAVSEDAGDTVIDLTNVFSDVDFASNGDVLTLTVDSNTNASLFNSTAITGSTAAVTGTTLTLDYADNQNGTAEITILATDGDGATVSDTFTVVVAAVDDDPFVDNVIPDVTVSEDAADTVIDLTNTFDDVDIATNGDTLTLTVDNVSDPSLFDSVSVAGTSGAITNNLLTIDYAAEQNGTADITILATDGSGLTVSDTFTVTVNAVDDAPIVDTPIADVTVLEDAVNSVIDLSGVFDDVDIVTNSDTLTLSVTGNTNGSLFSSVTLSGTSGAITNSQLTLDYAADENGTADITVTATDGASLTVTDTFTVTITPVNDVPTFTIGADQAVDEDAGVQTVTGFIADGSAGPANESAQSLTYDVSNDNNAMFAVQPAIDAAGELTYTPADDANGTATVTVSLSDDGGTANGGVDTSADQTFVITVNPVNDEPELIGADYSITRDEDSGNILVDFAIGSFFDDVDLANEGDTLTFTVAVDETVDDWVVTTLFGGDQTFDTLDDSVTLVLQPDASGTAIVDIFATDVAGATSDALNVSITINQIIDDAPVANDDFYTMDEDGDPLILEVLLNDDIGDGPTEVTLAGVGFKDPDGDGVWAQCSPNVAGDPDCTQAQADLDPPRAIFHGSSGQYVVNNLDETEFLVNRVRCINCGTSTDVVTFEDGFTEAYILYTPRPDFHGVDTFDYTITDVDGNTSTATVTVTVNPVNDAPDIAPNNIAYTIDQGTALQANVAEGLASKVFDRDNTVFDGTGCDPRDAGCTDMSQLYFQILDATTRDESNNLVATIDAPYCCDGEIDYTPVASFVGTDTFEFQVCDVPIASALAGNCTTLTVTVSVTQVSGAAQGSVDEVVEFEYDFSDAPLELPVPAIPNVAIIMDDSSPMILDMMTPEPEGIMYDGGDSWNIVFDATLNSGDLVPPEAADPERGLWRARTHSYNTVYYNPAYTYEPWEGLNAKGNPFADSPPTAAPDDPWGQSGTKTIDLTQPETIESIVGGGDVETTCSNPRVKVQICEVDTGAKIPDPFDGKGQVTCDDTNGTPIDDCPISCSDQFCDTAVTDPDDPYYCPEVCVTESVDGTVTTVDWYWTRYYVWEDKGVMDGLVDATPGWYTDPANSEGILVEIRAETGADEGVDNWPTGFDDGSDLYPKSDLRSDCVTVPGYCTLAEELQNFANYYTYARSREYSAKYAIGKVMADVTNMRVGIGFINGNNNNEPVVEMNEASDTGNKGTLLNAIYGNFPSGGTALRERLNEMGAYYARESQQAFTGGNNIDPADPLPEGNCRQNYALLVTAGIYDDNFGGFGADADSDGILTYTGSGVSNFDGGAPYPNGNAFAGCAGCDKTLADVAMYYYESDLRPLIDDEVPTTTRDLAQADESAFDNIEIMHQHMSTYVVAFGIEGSIDSEPADFTQPFDWGDPMTSLGKTNDLRHAAYNGRGAYLDASNPIELRDALAEAFEEFARGVGTASAVSFNSQEVAQGALVFRAFYNVKNNTGDLLAQTFNEDGEITGTEWQAALKLDEVTFDQREILTYDKTNHVAMPFRAQAGTCALTVCAASDTSCTTPLTTTSCLNQEQFNSLVEFDDGTDLQQVTERINYFRGDASNERPSGPFRERPEEAGRLGDIVNASPIFIGPPDRLRRNNPPYPQDLDSYAIFQDTWSARQGMLFAAANDGMLHTFNSETGEELFAYVPDGALTGTFNNTLPRLLNYLYSHQYFVDLTPAANDVFIPGPASISDSDREWRTMVVGGYGAGGKGYFALDVTDPATFSETLGEDMVLWEFTDDDDTYPTTAHDGTGTALTDGSGNQRTDLQNTPEIVKDLGYSFSTPTIAMSNVKTLDGNEQEWVVLFGNGFNSTSGIAKLYALFAGRGVDGNWCHPDSVFDDDLDPNNGPVRAGCGASDQDFVKIDTGFGVPTSGPEAGFPNGLGTPRAIDVDANGTVDYVYAGDSLGNLFRFDLTSDNYADWEVAKIFEAQYVNADTGETELQPIYNQPLVVNHPTEEEGYIVIFATGSYITNEDRVDDSIQSIYGIWDRLGNTLIERGNLVEQQYTNEIDGSFGNVRNLSENPVPYNVAATPSDSILGWYNDLDAVPAGDTQTDIPSDAEFPGEKAIRNIQLRGGLVFVNSVIPRIETQCTQRAGGFALAFCPATGGVDCLGTQGIFDLNNDGIFDEADEVADQVVAGIRFEDSVPTDSTFFGGNRVTQLSDQSLDITATDTTGGANTGRLSWRRLDDL